MSDSDRKVVIEELRRPEQFLGVIRTGATPEGRGLNQLLPIANTICGLATFENLHNAVSSVDGVETLVLALSHYVLLYPNHPRPLRLTLVNPPEPAKLLERLTKFLSEPRNSFDRLPTLDVSIVATAGHQDRLVAAATLEGNAQDLVYEKVAAGRLDLRVDRDAHESLDKLVQGVLSVRPQHVVAIFDESAISVQRRRVERLLPMSPFCVRNEIVVDRMLGDISLSPHPGEPPFSDFVMMIHEFEQEQRDSTNDCVRRCGSAAHDNRQPRNWGAAAGTVGASGRPSAAAGKRHERGPTPAAQGGTSPAAAERELRSPLDADVFGFWKLQPDDHR